MILTILVGCAAAFAAAAAAYGIIQAIRLNHHDRRDDNPGDIME